MKGTGNSGIFETSYYDGSYLLFWMRKWQKFDMNNYP